MIDAHPKADCWTSRVLTTSLARGEFPEKPARAPRRLQDLMRAAGHGVHSRVTVAPKRAAKCCQHFAVRLRHRGQVCFQPIQEIEAPFMVAALAYGLGHTRIGVLAVVEPHSVR